MTDPTLAEVRKAAAEAVVEDTAARVALANPLPGATQGAMALYQRIPVDRWQVRPMCDGDYEVLVELDHPIRKVIEAQFEMAYHGSDSEQPMGFDVYTPRGPSMWQLAWMFSRPPLQVRDMMRSGGVEALKRAAEDEFYEQPALLLVRIYLAIAKQITNYWSTTQAYAPGNNHGEDAAADAPVNPRP